jgi:hypothetical protein
MNKQKLYFIFGIVLFVVAGLLLVYAIWSFTYCADIISDAKASGQLAASGNEYDIMSFYMENCSQYFVYSLLLAVLGLLLQKKEIVGSQATSVAIHKTQDSENDNELDEWFEEINDN